ncbi:MAG: hypothetical protein CVV22_07790 [Ignavibacteriae bacterium HGW-Ignavibacteriae-1]|jgi:hypothetical protein|nr:MAG: hypothetical protein CVV22_07790 [Ignavibacteriae bacterium HGW-Ignavibacteriae-1]
MKVVYFEYEEGCLEGCNVYSAYLDDSINKNFIDYLAKLGKLVYITDMKKPVFKVIVRGKYTMKGNENDDHFLIILPEGEDISPLLTIKEFIASYVG